MAATTPMARRRACTRIRLLVKSCRSFAVFPCSRRAWYRKTRKAAPATITTARPRRGREEPRGEGVPRGRMGHEVELARPHHADQEGQQDQPGEEEVPTDDRRRPPGIAAQRALARGEVVGEEAQVMDGIAARVHRS